MQFQGTQLYTSPNGVTWTTINLPVYGFGFTPGPVRGYLYGPQGIYETTDGVTYTASNLTSYTSDVYVGGDTLALVSSYGSAPAYIYKRS